ncbi:S8 family serine peptidase [Priestia sp. OVS21]|nr:S8 family serine peptidase [Priestia sp. OVS21]
MKIKKIIKIICITIILILGNSVLFKDNIKKVAASEMGKDEVREDSLLITCKDQEKMLKLEQLIRSNYKSQLTNIDKIEEANLLKVTLKNKASSRELLADLNGAYKDVVQESGYERKIKIDDTANELKELPKKATLRSMVTKTNDLSKDKNAFHSFQWDINIVTNDGKSYELQKGNHNVKVAIIDSGIDFNHPDLKENIISKGKSFVPNVDDTQDYLGHGTMVAGMIAANGKFMGVGPELGIVPYKVFQNGEAESSWIINAIIQAAKDNMDVINLSLSTYLSKNLTEDKVLMRAYQNALRYAKHHGSVVVASAGNDALNLNKPKEIAEKEDILKIINYISREVARK